MIVAYAAFFPIVVNTVAGAKRVDPTLLRAAATMGVSPADDAAHGASCPAALPSIGVGLRIGMGVAWTAIIAAELAVGAKAGGGGSGGIGQMMFVFYAYSIELNRHHRLHDRRRHRRARCSTACFAQRFTLPLPWSRR